MAKRRVLVLNHFAVPRKGAGGTRHVELLSRLQRWDYSLIAANRNLFNRRRYSSDELITVPTTPYRTNGLLRIVNWISYAVCASVRSLGEPKPDVVYASSPHLLAGLAGWTISTVRGCPFVFEVRDLWPDLLVSMGQLEDRSLLFRVMQRLEVFLYKRADRVVVLASGAVGAIVTKGISEDKLVYLPNAADPADFVVDEDRHDLRSRLGLEGRVFVYAGAHGPANGLDLLIDAASEIQDELPDVRFLLVGDGPSKIDLVARSEMLGLKNVEFREPIPKDDIPALLAASDVGLHVLRDVPIFRFGVSPNKLCDYLAAGLPVLTNSPGESSRLVVESGGGTAVDPDDIATGVRGLAKLSERELASMSRAGRAYMERYRNRSSVAIAFESMLDDLVPRQRGAGRMPKSSQSGLKRVFDVVCSAIGLAATAPVQVVLAILVRLTMGAPVLYRQVRPGFEGRPFEILKFRTMSEQRDSAGELLPDGERLNWLGALLRRSSLDELPELWNVLRGDMSLVGPRPLLMSYLERYSPEQARRHEVKPGITGLAQVSGRNGLDWEERLTLDVWYVDNWSLLLDLKILVKTVEGVLRREGTNAPGHATMPEFRGRG